MSERVKGLVIDLDRCVGCYACELACKQANNLPEGTRWIRVVELGPRRVEGKMCMDFLLKISDDCNFCRECVSTCPPQALIFCDEEAKFLDLLRGGKRYEVCHFQYFD